LYESPAKSLFLQAPFNVQHSKFNVFKRLYDNNFAENDDFDFLQLSHIIFKLSKIIELNPEDAKAYYNRGIAYYFLGQYLQAIKDYNKSIELNPEFAEAYYNRGFIYDKLGQYSQAIKDYNKAIELDSGEAKAYYNRGNAYGKLGQYLQAIKDYNKVIELDPENAKEIMKSFSEFHKKGGTVVVVTHTNEADDFADRIINLRNGKLIEK
jgi:tetratricopeptide (TPR) repeat protein